MIVKKEEWLELYNHREILIKDYNEKLKSKNEEINLLKKQIEELKLQKKPDEIDVTFFTSEMNRYGYYKQGYSVQIDKSTIDLSGGIRRQVYRILKSLTTTFNKELESKDKKIEELNRVIYNHTIFYDRVLKISFITKNKIKDTYDRIFKINKNV